MKYPLFWVAAVLVTATGGLTALKLAGMIGLPWLVVTLPLWAPACFVAWFAFQFVFFGILEDVTGPDATPAWRWVVRAAKVTGVLLVLATAVLFPALKLAGVVDWSWVAVLAPIWVPVCVFMYWLTNRNSDGPPHL